MTQTDFCGSPWDTSSLGAHLSIWPHKQTFGAWPVSTYRSSVLHQTGGVWDHPLPLHSREFPLACSYRFLCLPSTKYFPLSKVTSQGWAFSDSHQGRKAGTVIHPRWGSRTKVPPPAYQRTQHSQVPPPAHSRGAAGTAEPGEDLSWIIWQHWGPRLTHHGTEKEVLGKHDKDGLECYKEGEMRGEGFL